MSGNDKITTIRLKESTKKLIHEEGIHGETCEAVIVRIIKDLREYRRTCG